MTTNKHLTFSQRIQIESSLNTNSSFSTIARALGKHPSTISNEVFSRHINSNQSATGRIPNRCIHRSSCNIQSLCADVKCRKSFCRSCKLCNSLCPSFKEDICQLLSKSPYVCNGCSSRHNCTLRKKFYFAQHAQDDYELKLSDSRTGFTLSEYEIRNIDKLISPLIKMGQSLHHIYVNNRDSFICSERLLYRLIEEKVLSVKNIDLPRKVKYRERKKVKPFKVDKQCRTNRTYEDFKSFMLEHPDTPVVEMDTVEGKKGGKVVLTLFFRQSSFMLIFLRDSNDSQSVLTIFQSLFERLGLDNFKRLFPVILTDNGTEFSNPSGIEVINGIPVSRIFYCNPNAPDQKGGCEKNHEEIRKILPKYESLDFLNDLLISKVVNHINSYTRKKLNDKTPLSSFSFFYGDEIPHLLGVSLISPNDVLLKPSLVRKKVDDAHVL